jgi:hypothetical protein
VNNEHTKRIQINKVELTQATPQDRTPLLNLNLRTWRHLIYHMKTRACIALIAPGQEIRDLKRNVLEMIFYYINPIF